MKIKLTKKNYTNSNLKMFYETVNSVNKLWLAELEYNNYVTYNTQECYKKIVESLMPKFKYFDEIPQKKLSKLTIKRINDLEFALKKNIEIYSKNKKIFKDLDRKKIRNIEFRLQKIVHIEYDNDTVQKMLKTILTTVEIIDTDYDDDAIEKRLITILETIDRVHYYNSDFYNTIGFLTNNYHEDFYHISLWLKEHLDNNFKNYEPYDPFHYKIYKEVFYNMGIIHHIHRNFNGIVFEKITELELYKSLNLKNNIPYLKFKDKTVGIYFINKLKEDLLDKDIGEKWLFGILKEVDIPGDYFSRKKNTAKKGDSKKHNKYANELDELIESKLKNLIS